MTSALRLPLPFPRFLRGALAALSLAIGAGIAAPAAADFRGGGYISDINAACAPAGFTPGSQIPVRLRFTQAASPSSWTRVQVNFATRLESLSLYGPLTPAGTAYQRALGHSLHAYFRNYLQLPRMRAFVLEPLHPPRATLETATALRMRVELRHFASVEGCFVTLYAVVSR